MNGGNDSRDRHPQHGHVEPDRIGAQPDVPVVEVAARAPRRQRRRVEEDDRDRRLNVVGHERDHQPDDRHRHRRQRRRREREQRLAQTAPASRSPGHCMRWRRRASGVPPQRSVSAAIASSGSARRAAQAIDGGGVRAGGRVAQHGQDRVQLALQLAERVTALSQRLRQRPQPPQRRRLARAAPSPATAPAMPAAENHRRGFVDERAFVCDEHWPRSAPLSTFGCARAGSAATDPRRRRDPAPSVRSAPGTTCRPGWSA